MHREIVPFRKIPGNTQENLIIPVEIHRQTHYNSYSLCIIFHRMSIIEKETII